VQQLKKFLYLLTAVLILLTSCSNVVRITYKDGLYIDAANDIKYRNASVSYEPVSIGDEYARFGKTTLYTIPGTEPTEWLTEKYEGIGSVFYADNVTLPSLPEFGTVKIHVCVSGLKTISIATIDDAAVISALIDALENGEQTEAKNPTESYYLKAASDSYPFLYYNIIYIKSADGQCYLYDRGTKRCVAAGTLLDKYLPDN
jgi:hypothetical protein